MITRRKFIKNLPVATAAFLGACHSASPAAKEANYQTRVFAIISEKLGIVKSKIRLNSRFDKDLGADSLDTVEIVMEVEKAFDTHIPDQALEKMNTPGAIVAWLMKHK